MVTMIDEIFDRQYQLGRDALNASIGSALARVGKAAANAFAVLNAIEYETPWTAGKPDIRPN
jgi:hypothetical protein